MKKSCVLGAFLSLAFLCAGTPAFAYSSCSEAHRTCVQRCKADNPTDKACPSDHCDPKLNACRASGCWQEGRAYGGQEHCKLKK